MTSSTSTSTVTSSSCIRTCSAMPTIAARQWSTSSALRRTRWSSTGTSSSRFPRKRPTTTRCSEAGASAYAPLWRLTRGRLLQFLLEHRVRQQVADRVRALAVERLVGERCEHGSIVFLCAFAELPVREDIEIVAPDAAQDALAAFHRVHPQR